LRDYNNPKINKMAEVIKMPRMSDTMEEGVIVAWLVKEGETVSSGDTLAEVETDKATMELDSYFDGILLHIAVKEGAVPIDGVIAVIGEKGEDWKAAVAAAEAETENKVEVKTETKHEEIAKPVKETIPANSNANASAPTPTSAAIPVQHGSNGRIKISPLARSMANDAGISLESLSGSGDNGRIVKKDIEAFLKNPSIASKPKSIPTLPQLGTVIGKDEDVAISQMRKTIARRLSESKFGAPHFYLTIEINMTNTWDSRKRLNEVSDVKISFNDLVVKAVAGALKKHPKVNSSWLGDKIRYNGNINIGVAVAVEDGLLVPVIRNADQKSLSYINKEVRILADKAKVKKLSPEEMQGNTFTISNLGMFGIEEFTAIINPPDACILAVGGIIEKPIVENGEIKAGRMMKVTLSCDHRVVDGATGSEFLNTLKSLLEDPIRLLV
jgi:pyruvate dehydrogenase E2 component (dihydrolipoamide acetyltransferase)